MQSAKLQLAIQNYFFKTFNFKLQLLTFNFELLTSKDFQKGFIKLTKKTLVLLLAVLILLPSFSYLLLFKLPKKAEAAWYDETWAYRTSYSINNTGSAVSNQKVKLDIDTATLTTDKLQADCGDSRFTDEGDYI